MVVVNGDSERVVGVDFDRAQTFDQLTDKHKEWMSFEYRLVAEIGRDMVSGERVIRFNLDQTWLIFFYVLSIGSGFHTGEAFTGA